MRVVLGLSLTASSAVWAVVDTVSGKILADEVVAIDSLQEIARATARSIQAFDLHTEHDVEGVRTDLERRRPPTRHPAEDQAAALRVRVCGDCVPGRRPRRPQQDRAPPRPTPRTRVRGGTSGHRHRREPERAAATGRAGAPAGGGRGVRSGGGGGRHLRVRERLAVRGTCDDGRRERAPAVRTIARACAGAAAVSRRHRPRGPPPLSFGPPPRPRAPRSRSPIGSPPPIGSRSPIGSRVATAIEPRRRSAGRRDRGCAEFDCARADSSDASGDTARRRTASRRRDSRRRAAGRRTASRRRARRSARPPPARRFPSPYPG